MMNGLPAWRDWRDKLVLVKTDTILELRLGLSALAPLHLNDNEDKFGSLRQSQI